MKYNPWKLIGAQMIKQFPTFSRNYYQHQYPSSVRWIQSTLSHPIYRNIHQPFHWSTGCCSDFKQGTWAEAHIEYKLHSFNHNIFLFLCSTQLRYISNKMHLEAICVFYYYKLFAPTCLGLSEPLSGGIKYKKKTYMKTLVRISTSTYKRLRQAKKCRRKQYVIIKHTNWFQAHFIGLIYVIKHSLIM